MKKLTDYIAEAYEYNYNISNVPKYTSTGTDKVGINKTNNKINNKTNYTNILKKIGHHIQMNFLKDLHKTKRTI